MAYRKWLLSLMIPLLLPGGSAALAQADDDREEGPPREAAQAEPDESAGDSSAREPPGAESDICLEDSPEDCGTDSEGPKIYRTPLSGTLVKETPKEPRTVLFINPELLLGGQFSNYRSMGYFSFVNFGGGVGATYLEDWHFRLNVWAMNQEHRYLDRSINRTTVHSTWFIQPAAYAMYNAAHFPDWHYFVPMDLFLGAKLGVNVFLSDGPIGPLDDETRFLYGIAVLPRFYLYERMGIAPTLELTTIDYLKNFFFGYGLCLFWDFEVIGEE